MKYQYRFVSCSIALIGLCACTANPLAVMDDGSQTIALRVGQELDLTVGTVGPGAYQTPSISGEAVSFLGDSLISSYTPAGPRQLFRFQGIATGRAIIVLTHSGDEPTITDTVVVR